MNDFLMDVLGFFIGALFFSIPIYAIVKFILVIFDFKKRINKIFDAIVEFFGVFGLTFLFFLFEFQTENNCCFRSAAFSPEHRESILVVIVFCMLVFYITQNRKQIAPPLLELLYNTILVLGVTLNIILFFHIEELVNIGNLTIACFFLIRLIQNYKLIKKSIDLEVATDSKINGMAMFILKQNVWIQYPMLLILCVPILVLIESFLLLIGQQPDSMIKVFTETYKHGFSQWDYKCDNIDCGGHYLCSVAALGHPRIVKPIRYGHRHGGVIICNRQLLISNAFEEVIQDRFPKIHSIIRRHYDKVGEQVRSHYHLFSIAWISDLVYILMKPLEWVFLITLYLVERHPESKIASQYIKKI